MFKRFLSIFLVILMCITSIPSASFVANAKTVIVSGENGENGSNTTYSLYDDGTMVLSGSGKVRTYTQWQYVPYLVKNRMSIITAEVEEGITSLGTNAFCCCENLKTVKLPYTLTHIGYYTFNCCFSLENIILPSNLNYLDIYAFAYCRNLSSIYIPLSLKTIGKNAFKECNALTDVYYEGTEEQWKQISIDKQGNSSLLNANLHTNCNVTMDGKYYGDSEYIKEHIDFTNSNEYNNRVKEKNFALSMSEIESSFKYDWYKLISFNFENYYDVVISDLLMKQASLEKINDIAIEYVGKEQIETVGKIASYTETLINQYNQVGEFGHKIEKDAIEKFLTGELDTESNVYKILDSFLSKFPEAQKSLQSFLLTFDKIGVVGNFIDFVIKGANDFRDCNNYLVTLNAYYNFETTEKMVFERIRDFAKENGNIKLYNSLNNYISACKDWRNYIYEIQEVTKESTSDIVRKAFVGVYTKQVLSALAVYLSKTSLGAILSTKIAGCTVAGCIGAVFNGVSLGIGVSQLITGASAVSDNMCMVVAVGEISEYAQKAMKYYGLKLNDSPSETTAELFENAFKFYRDCQLYAYDNTIAALDKDSKSVAAKFFAKENIEKAEVLIETLDEQRKDYSRITCHKIDVNTLDFKGINEAYVYTGEPIMPIPTHEFYENGKDFSLTYSNNKNTGFSTIKINGTGNYLKGSREIKFKIIPDLVYKFIAKKTNNGMSLEWDKVTDITGYFLYVRTTNNGWKKIADLKADANSYIDTARKTGVYAIKPYKKIGDAILTSRTYTVSTEAPSKVENITAKVSESAVKITWDAVSDAIGYSIYQYKNNKWELLVENCYRTNYTFKNLTSGTAFKFAVRAFNYEPVTNTSRIYGDYAEITCATKPSKIGTVKVSARTDSSLTLKWSKVAGVTGYRIYSYNASTQKYTKVATTSNTSYMIKNLKANTQYTYAVRGYKKVDGINYWGDYSELIKAKTEKISAPEKVVGLKITNSGKSKFLKLSWNKQSGVTGYQIYRSTTGKDGSYKKVATLKSTVTSFSESNLKSSTTYYYAVRAYKTQNGITKYGSFAKINGSTKLTNSFIVKKYNEAFKFSSIWFAYFGRYTDDYDYVIDGNGRRYCRVVHDSVKSKADLIKLSNKHFTDELSKKIVNEYYVETNGKLFAVSGELGSIYYSSLSETTAKIVSQTDETCRVKVKEVVRFSENEIEGTYTRNLELVYINGVWVFKQSGYWGFDLWAYSETII